MNLFFGLVTVIAFISAIIFGIYQYKQAKDGAKKLEEAQLNIKELEEGLLLSDFKLKKAVQYYEDGHYKNSLEVFQKYSRESEDISEFKEIVKAIFWKETRKIYSQYLGKTAFTTAVMIVAISKADEVDSEYPEFLNKLLDLYVEKSGDDMSAFYIPIFLNQGRHNEAAEQAPKYRATKSKKANDSFKDFLVFYCRAQQQQSET